MGSNSAVEATGGPLEAINNELAGTSFHSFFYPYETHR